MASDMNFLLHSDVSWVLPNRDCRMSLWHTWLQVLPCMPIFKTPNSTCEKAWHRLYSDLDAACCQICLPFSTLWNRRSYTPYNDQSKNSLQHGPRSWCSLQHGPRPWRSDQQPSLQEFCNKQRIPAALYLAYGSYGNAKKNERNSSRSTCYVKQLTAASHSVGLICSQAQDYTQDPLLYDLGLQACSRKSAVSISWP